MARPPQFPFPLPRPSPAEAAALRTAGHYLARTAAAAGTRRLQPWLPRDEAALLDVLREQARAGAALCDGLLDLAPGLDRRG